MDNKTGTSGDDTFDGSLNAAGNVTFQAFDSLDGGAGTDKLIAQGLGNLTTTSTTLKSIEQLEFYGLTNAGGGVTRTIDLTNTSGVESILVSGAVGVLNAVTGINSGIKTLAVTGNATAGAETYTFTAQNAAAAGAADSVKLVVDGVGDSTTSDNIVVQPTSGTNGFETIDLVASGSGSFVALDDGGATSLATVNVEASSALTLGLTPATVRTVDASKSTAAVNVTVASGNVTVTGGSGNDTINVAGNYSTTQTKVDGGEGRDTLRLNSAEAAQTSSQTARITNIENLTLADALNNNINLANWGATSITLTAATTSGAVTFSEGTGTLVLGAVNHAGSTNTVVGSLTGATDVLDITVGTATTANTNGGTVNASNFETVNVTALGGAAGMTALALSPVAATTVNFLGSFGGNYGTVTAANIDASGVTLGAATDTGVTVTAGGASKITGSGGVDVLTGSAAADTILGGAGNDTIRGGGGNDVITGGAGADTISVLAAGNVANGTALTVITSAADSYVSATNLTNADTFQLNTGVAADTYTVTFNTGVAATTVAAATAVNLGTTTVTANGYLLVSAANATTGVNADAVLYQDTNGNGVIEAGEFATQIDYDGLVVGNDDTYAITVVGGAAVLEVTAV